MKQENQFSAGFIVKRRIMNLFGLGLVGIALLMGGMVCAQQRVFSSLPRGTPVVVVRAEGAAAPTGLPSLDAEALR